MRRAVVRSQTCAPSSPRHLRLVALAGFVPPMALAVYALTEPWARARLVFFWGITRSPGAALLVGTSLAACLVVGLAMASRGRRPALVAGTHAAIGMLLVVVALLAYRMVQHAGVRALGLIPIASVHPGRGLRLFFVAGCLLLGLGLLEALLVRRWRRARRRDVAPAAPPGAA
jgi:hypothetical protein